MSYTHRFFYSIVTCFFLLLPAFAKNNLPTGIEIILIHWPNQQHTVTMNPLIEATLHQKERDAHRVLSPSTYQEPNALALSNNALLEQKLLAALYPFYPDLEEQTLWIDQTQENNHIFGQIIIKTNHYSTISTDLIFENGEHYWPIHMSKKSKANQINYIESMPIGMLFYLTNDDNVHLNG